MAYRDIKNSIDTAKQEGKNEKALEIAKNMLADGVDINLIKKYSGLTCCPSKSRHRKVEN